MLFIFPLVTSDFVYRFILKSVSNNNVSGYYKKYIDYYTIIHITLNDD